MSVSRLPVCCLGMCTSPWSGLVTEIQHGLFQSRLGPQFVRQRLRENSLTAAEWSTLYSPTGPSRMSSDIFYPVEILIRITQIRHSLLSEPLLLGTHVLTDSLRVSHQIPATLSADPPCSRCLPASASVRGCWCSRSSKT